MTQTATTDELTPAAIRDRVGSLLAVDGWSRDRLVAYQRAALRDLLAHAVAHSPYYREALGPDAARAELDELPTLPKALLMEQFDRIVTDPALRVDDLRAFLGGGGSVGVVRRPLPGLRHLGLHRGAGPLRLLARGVRPLDRGRARPAGADRRRARHASGRDRRPRRGAHHAAALRGVPVRARGRAAAERDDAARRDRGRAERLPARGGDRLRRRRSGCWPRSSSTAGSRSSRASPWRPRRSSPTRPCGASRTRGARRR